MALALTAFLGLGFNTFALNPVLATASNSSINIWWPTQNVNVTGSQSFKAMLQNASVENYNMFWQVDSGQYNHMYNSYSDYPHKEAIVDLSGWNWKGSGPYAINFIAQDFNGNTISSQSANIFIGNLPAPLPTVIAPPQLPLPVVVPAKTNPLAAQKLWVNPYSDAANYANRSDISWNDRQLMQKVASGAETQWFSRNWISNIYQAVRDYVGRAQNAGAVPTMVLYDIPFRDCGQFSAGGANDQAAYKQTVDQFAAAIGSSKAAVIIEPDALALMDCLSASQKQQRFDLLKYAVQKFAGLSSTAAYLDIGHSGWKSPQEAAQLLSQAGIQEASGFALNVAGFNTDDESIAYGQQINNELNKIGVGSAHFVIDSGRNGNGSNGQWCNPYGRALGRLPTTNTGNSLVDAFLWVKGPSGSDGYCNNGPAAGQFFPSYALDLARSAHW